MSKRIDLNADCYENYGRSFIIAPRSEEVVEHTTSAHMGCGFHGGSPTWMKKAAQAAKKFGTNMGAHPGLPDLLGLGRRILKISPEEAECYTTYQVGAAKAFLEDAGIQLSHVKPHGAFYVICKDDEELAEAFIRGIKAVDKKCNTMLLPAPLNYKLASVAEENGIKVAGEYYPELLYDDEGEMTIWNVGKAKELKPKKMTAEAIVEKIVKFAAEEKINTIDDEEIDFKAQSVCVHGDNPDAPEILRSVKKKLEEKEIDVTPAKEILG